MSLAIALHELFAVLWVGGMFFVLYILRPVMIDKLEAPAFGGFMYAVLKRFFYVVWASAIIMPLTGFWMLFSFFGGGMGFGIYLHIMAGLGTLMVLLFVYLYFRLFLPFERAIGAKDAETAKGYLGRIRHVVQMNLALGVIVIVVASSGAYWG